MRLTPGDATSARHLLLCSASSVSLSPIFIGQYQGITLLHTHSRYQDVQTDKDFLCYVLKITSFSYPSHDDRRVTA